jgi:hypothetical protein
MTTRWVSGVSRDLIRTAFRDYLGVADAPADVLVTLFELDGRPIATKLLCAMVNSHRPLSAGALHERIRVLRQAMESEAVDFEEEAGYFLTDVGMDECNRALRKMAEAMVAGGWELPTLPALRAPRPPRKPPAARSLPLFQIDGEGPE